MANEEAKIKVKVDAGEATAKMGELNESTKTLKQQIKEAEKEAIKFGDATSKEAIEAAKKVAMLKEQFADFKDRVDAFHPEAKFQAVAKLASGIAGGFGAAQGAMALFGSESEDVQKALLKVQAALALSQGLNEIKGLTDAWGNFKLVALDALSGIKKAIMANPFTALIGGLAAVTAGVLAWLAAEDDLIVKIKEAREAEKQRFEASQKQYDREIALAKALGQNVSDLERQKQLDRLKTVKENIRLMELERNFEIENEIKKLKLFNQYSAEKEKQLREQTKEQKELNQELLDAENSLTIQRISLLDKANAAALNANIKKKESNAQVHREEKVQREKEIELIEKKTATTVTGAEKQLKTLPETASQVQYQFQQATFSFNEQIELMTADLLNFFNKGAGLAVSFGVDTIQTNLNTVSSFMDAAMNNQLKAAEGNEKRQEQIRKTYFERQKKVQIAMATISMFEGALQAFKSTAASPVTILFPAAPYIAAASALALGASNIAKIKSQTYQGGSASSGGAPSAPNFGGGGTPTPAPQPNQGTTNLDRDRIEAGQKIVIHNTISETEITRTQKRVGMIQERSTIK